MLHNMSIKNLCTLNISKKVLIKKKFIITIHSIIVIIEIIEKEIATEKLCDCSCILIRN